jgi:hypothetical protein
MLRVLVRWAGELPSNGVISLWGTLLECDEKGGRGGISGTYSDEMLAEDLIKCISCNFLLNAVCYSRQLPPPLPPSPPPPHPPPTSSPQQIALQSSKGHGPNRNATLRYIPKVGSNASKSRGVSVESVLVLVVVVVAMTRLACL